MNIISTKLSILLNSLNSQALLLPEIQRDFVWTKPRIVALLDSLFRGFPIGAMLVWKTSSLIQVKRAKGIVNDNSYLKSSGELIHGYLLDGQQRLTALLMVLNEEIPIRFHLIKGIFEIEKRKNRENPLFILLSDALSDKIEITGLLHDLKKADLMSFEDSEKIIVKNYLKVTQLLNRNVAVLEYPSESYSDATSLFIRFNSGGVKLKPAELAIAELARSAPSLVSEEIKKFAIKWHSNGFAFTIPFLAKCLAVIKTGSVRFNKPDQIWLGTDEELRGYWGVTKKAIEKTIGFLNGTMHWDSTSWLSSYNALIPIIYIFAKSKTKKQITTHDSKILKKWLAIATLRGRYSMSADTRLDSDIKKLKKEYSAKGLWSILNKNMKKKISENEIDEASRSGPLMSVYYSMLKEKGAKDWLNGKKIDGSILGHNSSLEVHHIFPRSVLYEERWSAEWVNSFSNLALLYKSSNIEISNKKPIEYLRMNSNFDVQCIPENKNLWELVAYEDFLYARERLLQKHINNYLKL